jgi:hypothetical protein
MNCNIPKAAVLFVLMITFSACQFDNEKTAPIRPSADFPGYWEYKGDPVLLLGGTRNDNLFQEADAPDHLRELAAVGGNYIRNTMSARDSGEMRAAGSRFSSCKVIYMLLFRYRKIAYCPS